MQLQVESAMLSQQPSPNLLIRMQHTRSQRIQVIQMRLQLRARAFKNFRGNIAAQHSKYFSGQFPLKKTVLLNLERELAVSRKHLLLINALTTTHRLNLYS